MVLPTRRTKTKTPQRKKTGIQLFKKNNTNSNSGPGKLTGKARALSRVKNATARAAISKSPGKTFPAGNLARQAANNVRKMVNTGGGTTTRVRSTMPKQAVATQKRASSTLRRHR